MTGTAELAELYSAMEKTAGLLGIPCARDTVWPIMTAYGDSLAQAVVAFRVATGRDAGDLDCRFTMLPKEVDPYALALSRGLAARTDHPVGTLLTDIEKHCPVECYGIDFGLVGGFKKTWSFLPPDDLQKLSTLAEVPSMPGSLGENLGFFGRYGLDDKASLIGIDYPNRTVNLYLGEAPAECFRPETMRSMLHDLGLPAPSERLLRLGQVAFGIYTTLTWDTAQIKRITFAAMTQDLTTLPIPVEPKIDEFVRNAPYGSAERRFVYAVTATPAGEYDKLQSYYQWRPRMGNLMLLADSAAEAG